MALLIMFKEIEITTDYGKITILCDEGQYIRRAYFNVTGFTKETEVGEDVVSALLKSYSKSYRILK